MFNNVPLTTIPTWKYTASIVFVFLLVVVGLYYSHRYVYEQGIMKGITMYHAQCLVGGFLVDDQGQAVVCGPLSKAPQEEKQTYKDKVLAPSLFK